MTNYNFFETKKLYESAKSPTKGHLDDAGWDLYAFETVSIPAGATVLVSTGIAIAIPKGHSGLIWDRSSMGVKGVHRHAGVIDCGYRGEVKVCLHNTTKEPFHVEAYHTGSSTFCTARSRINRLYRQGFRRLWLYR